MRRHAFSWGPLFLLAACLASTADAQDQFAEVEHASRDLPLEQRPPFGGLSEFAWLSRHWSVNTFYTVFRGQHPDQTRFWVVRRVSGSRDGAGTVQWADSRSCPAVEQTLIAMERLPAVTPDAPQLGEEAENINLVMDGAQHMFWNRLARSGEPSASVRLEITGNVDSPVAKWWSASAANLADCWRETPPS